MLLLLLAAAAASAAAATSAAAAAAGLELVCLLGCVFLFKGGGSVSVRD